MTEREKAIRLAKAYFGAQEVGEYTPTERYIHWPEGYRGGLMYLKVKDASWRGVWNPYLNIEHAKMLQMLLEGVGVDVWTEEGIDEGFRWGQANGVYLGGEKAKRGESEAEAISDLALEFIGEFGIPDSVLAEMLNELKPRL